MEWHQSGYRFGLLSLCSHKVRQILTYLTISTSLMTLGVVSSSPRKYSPNSNEELGILFILSVLSGNSTQIELFTVRYLMLVYTRVRSVTRRISHRLDSLASNRASFPCSRSLVKLLITRDRELHSCEH